MSDIWSVITIVEGERSRLHRCVHGTEEAARECIDARIAAGMPAYKIMLVSPDGMVRGIVPAIAFRHSLFEYPLQ